MTGSHQYDILPDASPLAFGVAMQIPPLRRRELFTVLGGLGIWPLVATAQEGAFVRRVAVVMF